MTIFQILIKWPEMIVSGCYIAQNDRNLHSVPEINVRSRYLTRNISNLKKKARGYKNEQKFFCHFWFCAICGSNKSCLILKFIPPKTILKILSFESISVFVSQKLRNLEQKNIGEGLFRRTVRKVWDYFWDVFHPVFCIWRHLFQNSVYRLF